MILWGGDIAPVTRTYTGSRLSDLPLGETNNPPEVNNPPVANDQSISTDEDTAIVITISGSDLDGDALTFSIVDNPLNGTLTITPINATSAEVTYTPDTGFNGTDSFTFKANDGTDDSNTATVDVTVNAFPPP